MSFGGESGLRQLGLCGIHPLTQRYTNRRKYDIRDFLGFYLRPDFGWNENRQAKSYI
nr:DUF3265 domain-containing protein [Vibrio vulnificus]